MSTLPPQWMFLAADFRELKKYIFNPMLAAVPRDFQHLKPLLSEAFYVTKDMREPGVVRVAMYMFADYVRGAGYEEEYCPKLRSALKNVERAIRSSSTRLRLPFRLSLLPAKTPPDDGCTPRFGPNPARGENTAIEYVGIGFIPLYGENLDADILHPHTVYYHDPETQPLRSFPKKHFVQ